MSIFKKIRKGFKKLGSSIAKRMRKIGRGVKKGFAKLTKAFGKLGPLGHIALFFILPGMGQVLGSWMGQFGNKVLSMLPKGFAKTLTTIGTKIKSAATFAYDNTIGAVYNTVSKALTAGIDAVTAPFMGGQGAATRFQNFVNQTADRFSASPADATMSETEITQVQNEAVSKTMGPDQPIDPNVRASQIEARDKLTPEDRDLVSKELKRVQDASKGVNNPVYQYNNKTGKYEIFDGDKLEKAIAGGADTTIDIGGGQTTKIKDSLAMPKPVRTINVSKKPGVFRSITDGINNFKTNLSGTKVFGTDVTVGESAALAKDVSGVYSAYQYFNPDEVGSAFYNPNIGMANALNTPNDPYTMSSMATNFISTTDKPTTLNDSADFYASMFGNSGPDPIYSALNAPGFGLSFEDYIYG